MFATLLLLACRPTESDPQDDSAPADVAPCELAHPWEMGTAEDVELGLLRDDTFRADHERWFNFVDLDIFTKRIFRKQFIERGLIYNIALLITRNIHHHE